MNFFSFNKLESWLSSAISISIDLIYKYYITLKTIIFKPSLAISEINKEDEKYMSPLLFFLFNVTFISLLSNSDTANIFTLISQVINSPIKPENTNSNFITTFLSYLLGGLIFIIIFQFFTKRVINLHIDKLVLIKAISYASAIFIPIFLIKKIVAFIIIDIISLYLINNFNYHWFIEYTDSSINQANLFLQAPYILLIMLILNLIITSWWLYLVFIGIYINNIFSKIKLVKTLIYSIITITFLFYLVIQIPAINQIISKAKQGYIENLIISNLQENEPKYGKIAFLCELIGNDKNLSNYIRYRYTLMASIYIVGNLDGTQPLFKEAKKALLEKRYDWVEQNLRRVVTNTLKDDSEVATKIAKHDLIHILSLLDSVNALKQTNYLENDEVGKLDTDKITIFIRLFP